MQTQPVCLNEAEIRRQIRPYFIVGLSAYLVFAALFGIMILCALTGYAINFRVLGIVFALMVLIRRFSLEFIARRVASLTGQPQPRTSIVGHIVCALCVLVFVALFWNAG